MSLHGRKSADEAVLLALACGATAESAAHSAGVSARTVSRRLKDPRFHQRLQTLRAEMLQRAAGMLTAASLEAVKTLLVLQQASVPAAVRLGAARTILEIGIKLRQMTDLDERLTALEQHLAASKPMADSGPCFRSA